jgi:RNA polymerase sigma factor (sigma-70 family)
MPEHNPHTVDIAALVRGAAAGERQAWERLVEQYARLIWSITADFKLADSDAADVVQTTWLRLLEHIHRIEYPDRVGSWLAATARNECLRSLAARKRVILAHDEEALSGVVATGPEVDERILAAERDQVVRDALSRLPGRWQRLLELLMAHALRRHLRRTGPSHGQHRPHPGTVPGPASRATAGVVMSRPSPHTSRES